MGMQMYVKSGTFNPNDYDLKVGDVLNIICVGGGQGGATSAYRGGNGASSSFGSFVTAYGA
ncbi:MAG: hypothetical protein N4A63_08060, partial [Vallitalea sp.]|nr:hypothetical protein [Vallitalea sp.]